MKFMVYTYMECSTIDIVALYLYSDIEEDSGLILYFDFKLLAYLISSLYCNLAQSIDDAYWILIVADLSTSKHC